MQTALQYPQAGHAVPGAIVQKRAIAFIDVPARFKKGQTVFSEGSTALHFYEVVSGTVRTSQLLKDGRRLPVSRSGYQRLTALLDGA